MDKQNKTNEEIKDVMDEDLTPVTAEDETNEAEEPGFVMMKVSEKEQKRLTKHRTREARLASIAKPIKTTVKVIAAMAGGAGLFALVTSVVNKGDDVEFVDVDDGNDPNNDNFGTTVNQETDNYEEQ